MLRLFIALAVMAVCQGLPRRLQRDGGDFSLQIVGGFEADITDFPHQISMRMDGSHICGGSILNEQWILTAGHCVNALYGDTSTTSIRAGSTSQLAGGQELNVMWAGMHPEFDIDTMVHDVALMKLSAELNIDGVSTRAVKLVPVGKSLTSGQLLTVSGWGTLHSGDWGLPSHLMAVMVPAIPLDVCRQVYATQELLVDDTMICAGIGGKDSCQGDSGGPLVDDLNIQVGVVSWGIGCGTPGYPGLYANLAHPVVQQWIVKKAGLTA